MIYIPLDNEIALLPGMSAQQRMEYATTRMIECEEVWSLGDGQGWRIHDVDGRQSIAIWPYHHFAQEFGNGEPGMVPHATSLENFLDEVLELCAADNIDLEVFPTRGDGGRLVTAAGLYQLLNGLMESSTYVMEG